MIDRIEKVVRAVYEWLADPKGHPARSWGGHSLVWTGLIGRGLAFGALAGLILPPVTASVAAAVGVVVGFLDGATFYGNREFGPGGDFWSKDPDDRAGRIDSKMDLWLPLIVAFGVAAALLTWLLV